MKTVMGSTPASVVSDVGAALYDTELKLLGSLEDIVYSVTVFLHFLKFWHLKKTKNRSL